MKIKLLSWLKKALALSAVALVLMIALFWTGAWAKTITLISRSPGEARDCTLVAVVYWFPLALGLFLLATWRESKARALMLFPLGALVRPVCGRDLASLGRDAAPQRRRVLADQSSRSRTQFDHGDGWISTRQPRSTSESSYQRGWASNSLFARRVPEAQNAGRDAG